MSSLKIKKILGYVWASPVTLLGLLYASLFWALGWYNWGGVEEDGLVWEVDNSSIPNWLKAYWRNWGGHAIGNVVVLKYPMEKYPELLAHELRHVEQVMRLGVFQPIVYGINLLAIRVGCPGTDPYHYNPFEVDARRVAGQDIEVNKT